MAEVKSFDNLLATTISSLMEGDKKQIKQGMYHIERTVTLKIVADINKGADYEAAPTVSIPFKTVLALMFEKAGATKNSLINMFIESAKEALLGGEQIEEKLKERFIDYDDAMFKVTKSLGQLPKVNKSGPTKIQGKIEILTD